MTPGTKRWCWGMAFGLQAGMSIAVSEGKLLFAGLALILFFADYWVNQKDDAS